MRVDLIKLVRSAEHMNDPDKVAQMIADETDVERIGILSHRLAELREKD